MLDQQLEIASVTEGQGKRRVRIDAGGVWISDRLSIPREEIAQVRVELAEREELWIFRADDARRPACTLAFTERTACDEAVRALGRLPDRVLVGAAGGVPIIPWGWSRSSLAVTLACIAIAICMAFPAFGIVLLLPYSVLMVFAAFGRRIDVCADGVVLRPLLFGSERITYAVLDTVERREDIIIFHHRDGQSRRVGAFSSEQGERLIACIMQRMARYREPCDTVIPLAGVDTVYRVAATVDDELWRVIESPSAPLSARRRAVNELAEPRDDERLHIAVEATIDPEVVFDLRARRASR